MIKLGHNMCNEWRNFNYFVVKTFKDSFVIRGFKFRRTMGENGKIKLQKSVKNGRFETCYYKNQSLLFKTSLTSVLFTLR